MGRERHCDDAEAVTEAEERQAEFNR
jgi:hypothetical protein